MAKTSVNAEGPLGTAATHIPLSPIKDNTLYEDAIGTLSNGIGQSFFAGCIGVIREGGIRRGLIALDVAGQIPAGATIVGASLTLHMSRTISGP